MLVLWMNDALVSSLNFVFFRYLKFFRWTWPLLGSQCSMEALFSRVTSHNLFLL